MDEYENAYTYYFGKDVFFLINGEFYGFDLCTNVYAINGLIRIGDDISKINQLGGIQEVGKENRDNQKASENYAKYKAEKLEKAAGKGARRDAHDAKDKIGCDRTKKELDEDYKTIK